MMADFIIAADTAKFGQPEIKLGVTPGMGGSQRLAHAVGKAKAMEMCLTGRMMDAAEAERSGLVAKVVPAAELLDEALKTAEAIAAMPPLAAVAVKEMVNAAFEIPLGAGHPLRAAAVPRPVRDRGPEGRHGRLRRKAAGQMEGADSRHAATCQDPGRRRRCAREEWTPKHVQGDRRGSGDASHSSALATWAAEWRRTLPRRGMKSARSTSAGGARCTRSKAAAAAPDRPRKRQGCRVVITMLPAAKACR